MVPMFHLADRNETFDSAQVVYFGEKDGKGWKRSVEREHRTPALFSIQHVIHL